MPPVKPPKPPKEDLLVIVDTDADEHYFVQFNSREEAEVFERDCINKAGLTVTTRIVSLSDGSAVIGSFPPVVSPTI